MGGRGWLAFAALVCVAPACGDDDGTSLDGGDAATDAGPELYDGSVTAPAPPAPVDPPVISCPPRWREVADPEHPEIVTCDPWPEGGPPACAPGEAIFPGETACAPLGTSCPAGDFAEDVPTTTPVLFVRGGGPSGDGSRDAPFATIGEAIAAASPGITTTIAIARGEYDELLRVPAGITLHGACAHETIIRSGATATARGVVEITGAGVGIRNLQVGPSPLPGVVAIGLGRSLSLWGVQIVGTRYALFSYSGARVTGERVVARDSIGSHATPKTFGAGFDVETGATMELRQAIAQNCETGVLVSGRGAILVLEDAAVLDSISGIGFEAPGASIQRGGHAELRRVVFERNVSSAIGLANVETTADLEDVLIRDGIRGALVTAAGITVNSGSSATGRRVVIDRAADFGAITHLGAVLELSDAVIRDTDGTGRTPFGDGLRAQEGGVARASRVVLLRNQAGGAVVTGDGTLELQDVRVADTRENADGALGHAIVAFDGTITVMGARLERSSLAAIWVAEAGNLSAADVTVTGVRGGTIGGFGGEGVLVEGNAQIRRIRIERAREVGVYVAGGSATLEDLVVAEMMERECVASTCAGEGAGMGLGVYGAGRARADRFEILDGPLCGVQIAAAAELDLADGLVTGYAAGACVQVPGYDQRRLTARVRYLDNDVAVSTVGFAVPDPPMGE